MKAKRIKMLSLALAATMLLAACGGGGGKTPANNGGNSGSGSNAPSNGGEPIKEIVLWESSGTRELENFFIQNTEQAKDLNVLCNAYAPLLEIDNKGVLQPAVATEWGSEDDGLTWTFKLRDGVTWVDVDGNYKADLTSQDWVTGLEWVLNFHKNGANNVSMPIAMIEGAKEYHEWTESLSPEEAMALDTTKFLEMVGIEAPDANTLIYHCWKNAPYFDTVATSACLYPLSQGLIDELGVENMVGMSNSQMWYSGPYTITSYIMNNEKVLTKNPSYWDKDASLFDTVTIRMVGDTNLDDQLYETGEVDQCDLDESNLRAIYEDENHEFHDQLVEKRPRKYSYQMHFNFQKLDKDGNPDVNWNKAAANENFRKSIYYGMDLTNRWARDNFIYPSHCENLAYTMKGLLYFSDGTDYVDKVIQTLGYPTESDGQNPRRYDAGKAAEYRDKAIEELTAQGVTFPVEMDYYVLARNQAAQDAATVLKNIIESIGDNYIKVNIKTYVASLTQEVTNVQLHSVNNSGWGADYGDPENFLGQELYQDNGAYYSNKYSYINKVDEKDAPELIATYKEFTEMARAAGEICDDLDARYQAYVDAEVYFLEHALTIPFNYEVVWQLTHVNDYSKMEAMYGCQTYTYKNWETSTEAYTTADYEGFLADFNS